MVRAMTPVTDPLILKSLEGASEAQPAPPEVAAALSGPEYAIPGVPRLSHLLSGLVSGLVQSVGSAATLPGDVYTGKQPIMTPGGAPDPQLMDRTFNLATMAAMPSPAALTGRLGQTAIPTATELKEAGSAGYNAMRNSGLEIRPNVVVDTANGLMNDLTRRGFGADVAPEVHNILNKVATPPTGGFRTFTTADDLEAIRANLGNSGATAKAQEAARRAVGEFDRVLEGLTPKDVVAGPSAGPGLLPAGARAPVTQQQLDDLANLQRDARANYAASFRANALTGELDKAATGAVERADLQAGAANSGLNFDNAMRQQVKALIQNKERVKGFSAEEIQALTDFAEGGSLRNTTRLTSNLLGGGQGLGGLAAGAAGAGVGSQVGGLWGMLLGAGVPAAGYSLKQLQNALARREIGGIEELVRSRSPLAQTMLGQTPIAQPNLRDVAVMQALMPGLLGAMQPQNQPVRQPQQGLLGPLI